MASFHVADFADTSLGAPYRSEAFAEDLLDLERRYPAPEAAWINPYALPTALLLVVCAALLAL